MSFMYAKNKGEKMKQFVILFILLMATTVFASITPTTIPDFVIYGGEDKNITFTIKNDFSYNINAEINFELTNTSGDYEGILTNVYPDTFFEIKAYNEKQIIVGIETVPNLSPGDYSFDLQAKYYLSTEQTPIRTETVRVGGGGGTTRIVTVDKNIIVDKNIYVNTPVEVIKEIPVIKEVVKEVEKVIYKDNNTTSINNEPNWFFIITTIGLIGIILLLITVFVISKPKGGN